MKDVVIIPTYNEKENIRNIVGRVTGLYPEMEVWVVDDNSPDGTAVIVSEMAAENPRIKLFSRPGKSGLGAAYKYIHAQIQKMSDIRYIVTMDADGSHDPASIKALLEALSEHDLAVGSRYVRGGKIVGWDIKRLALSYFGNIYSGIVTGLPIRDGTAGFVAFRHEALRGVDLGAISSSGYSYQIEFKGSIVKQGKSYCEVPITFTDRIEGTSKMSGGIVFEGLLMPWRILLKDRQAVVERFKQMAVGAVFLLAIFFATFNITESPPVWYDEGIYIQSAVNTLEKGEAGFQLSPGNITHISRVSVSFPFVYPLAAWFKIFGTSIFSARSFMVLILLGFLLVAFAYARRQYGSALALGTLLLLSTFPPLYGNGKSVLGEVPGLLYLGLSLLCFNVFRSEIERVSGRKKMWLVFACLFAGLAVVTKTIFIVLLPAVVVGLFFEWKRGALKPRDLLIAAVSFVLPILVWLPIQFQASDSFSSIVGFYANPYGVENLLSVIFKNALNFVSSATPLYLLIMMVVWFAAGILRLRRKIYIPVEEVIGFVFCSLLIVAYLRIVGWYRYIFPAQIVAIIYFLPSLEVVLTWLKGKFSVFRKYSFAFIIAPVVALAVFGFYGLTFHSWTTDSYGSRKTAFWEEYFENISAGKKAGAADTSFFFYNVPEVTIFSKNRNYYQYIAPAGGAFSEKELGAIDAGVADKIILRTDTFENEKARFEKKYHIDSAAYKYTILTRNSLTKNTKK